MITKFDSLFAGHADLRQCRLRRHANQRAALRECAPGHRSSKAESMAKLMDNTWLQHCFWTAEHHFQREGAEYIPNNILLAVHLAHRTKKMRIGCGFNITPMWHPLRLAEDYATADILTGGRVDLASVAVITPARSRHSARPCVTRRPTASCSRSRSTSSSKPSTRRPFRTRVSTTHCRPKFPTAATR